MTFMIFSPDPLPNAPFSANPRYF